MTDRELLEFAAKAAGIDIGKAHECKFFYCEHGQCGSGMYLVEGNHFQFWNPLEDDGDALRIVSALRIDVMHWICPERTSAEHHSLPDGLVIEFVHEDRTLSIRRAIVRCAAEIGKAMP